MWPYSPRTPQAYARPPRYTASHGPPSRAGSRARSPEDPPGKTYSVLAPQEEESLVQAVQQLAAWGWPVTTKSLEALAIRLLEQRGDVRPLGRCWHGNFLTRHPGLKRMWPGILDQSRQGATSYHAAERWFELYRATLFTYDINEDDVYNMDEKVCKKGIGDGAKVIVSHQEKEALTAQPGSREWASVIECIRATGYILPYSLFSRAKVSNRAGSAIYWIKGPLSRPAQLAGVITRPVWRGSGTLNQYTANQTRGIHRLLVLNGKAGYIIPRFCTILPR